MFPVFVCTHELHIRQWWEDTGFVQSLEVLEKSWHLPNNFPDLQKVWKMEIKSGKMLFWKLQQVLYKWNYRRFGQILFNLACTFAAHHEMKSFVPAVFFKDYIDHLFDNLESGKRNHCFGITVWKNLNFETKKLYEPWRHHGGKGWTRTRGIIVRFWETAHPPLP